MASVLAKSQPKPKPPPVKPKPALRPTTRPAASMRYVAERGATEMVLSMQRFMLKEAERAFNAGDLDTGHRILRESRLLK